MRQALCARYKRAIAFKATLSVNKGYAPLMRQVQSSLLGNAPGRVRQM